MMDTNASLPPEQEAIRTKCFHPSGTFVEFPLEDVEASIPERFEKIARLFPDRLAISVNESSLTYGELNRAANRLASTILDKCGDKLRPILVLADHHLNGIVSCLGVLKAGKIMIAADPTYPFDRLAFMAEDSQAEAILGFGGNFKLATSLASRNLRPINVDALSSEISSDNVGLHRSPFDPASMGCTSGSTGRPKAVLRSHRRNLFTYMLEINCFHICPEDRVIVLRPFSSIPADTLTGLMAGEAVFPFDIRSQQMLSFGDFLNAKRITHFSVTPTLFRFFAQGLVPDEVFPHLRMIKFGGESLFRADVELCNKHVSSSCILINRLSGNEMGPICQYWMTGESKIETAMVPVGFPVEGKTVALLNEQQQEVGTDQIGEIVVTSRYLSSGYWKKTKLTNEPFPNSEASSDEQQYRSGDLGQRLSDGSLIYVGRKDDQVKIRGGKVTIGEIEAVLSEHPQIRQLAVVAIDRANGDKSLIAYVVPRSHPAPTMTELNEYLKTKLPDYMIPSALIFLNSLPLTNGKLDRRALPKPNNSRPNLKTAYVAPRNEVERKLTDIWTRVLGIDPIGIDDHFLDLGGHSLTATKLVSLVSQQFHLEIPLPTFFSLPTVAGMASTITMLSSEPSSETLEGLLQEVEALSEREASKILDQEQRAQLVLKDEE